MTSLLLTILLAAATGSPALEDLEKEIMEHIRSYDGLEFTVLSSYHFEPSKGDASSKFALPECWETIRLHFPEKDSIQNAWKYWVQEVPNKPAGQGQWRIDRFKVTDRAKTHNFRYETRWSSGSITPWHEWDEREGRTFFTFLGMSTLGMSLLEFDLTDDLKNQLRANSDSALPFVKEGECDGIKTFVFQGESTKTGYRYAVHFLSKGGMVVHLETTLLKENQSEVYHVDTLGIFEGIYYPKSGYHRGMPFGLTGKTDYKFEVTSVKRFDQELPRNWFPDWPSATSVRDIATEEITRIPPSGLQEIRNLNQKLDKDIFRKIAPSLPALP